MTEHITIALIGAAATILAASVSAVSACIPAIIEARKSQETGEEWGPM